MYTVHTEHVWNNVMAASPVLSFRVKPQLVSELDQLARATDRDRQYPPAAGFEPLRDR